EHVVVQKDAVLLFRVLHLPAFRNDPRPENVDAGPKHVRAVVRADSGCHHEVVAVLRDRQLGLRWLIVCHGVSLVGWAESSRPTRSPITWASKTRPTLPGLPPGAGDQPTGPPDVALVIPAEPLPQELLLRGR